MSRAYLRSSWLPVHARSSATHVGFVSLHNALLFIAALCVLFAAAPACAQNTTAFGQVNVGSSAGTQTITVTAQSAGSVAAANVLTLGQPALDYALSGTDGCTGANLSVGGTCQIAINFTPVYPGVRSGAIVLVDSSNNVLATQHLSGTGIGSLGVMVPGTMQTVVGSGQWTAVNDGSTAAAADLYLPSGVVVDGAGNIFIADSYHNRIREVYASGPNKGLIGTICNTNGVPSYSGDGGLAVNATLNNPRSIAIDGAGNLYIADSANNVIRKITASSGYISTIAGNGTAGYNGDGSATTVELNSPYGVTADASGNVYIADTSNQRIRKFTAATGALSTVAGMGDTGSNGAGAFSGDGGSPLLADLSLPYAVGFDGSGNMYIPDSGNNRIRVVYVTGPNTGKIKTFAGTGNPAYAGDGSAAGSASFYAPSGVAFDAAGNLYIADTQNNAVRKISISTGLVSTVAGDGTGIYGGDGGSATAAGLFGPYALFLDSLGDLFIADYFDHRIREIQSNVALLTFTPAIREDQVSAPQNQTIENDGNAALTFSAITPDANAAIYTGTPGCSTSGSLAIDGTCNVAAEFAPTEVGDPVIGNIILTGNPADSPLDIEVIGQALVLTSTTTTLTASPNPATYNQQVVLSASVTTGTGTIGGNITFKDGSTTLGQVTVTASGQTASATFTTSTLAVGAHNLTAVYGGDGVHGTSTSSTYAETVKQPTTTVVISSENPSVFGDSVNFTATITPAADGGTAPTGTVIFYDGSTVLGSQTMTGNTATITISSVAVGAHSIKASYGGDAQNAASISTVMTQTVNPTASLAVVISNNNPSIATKPVTFTVTVTGSAGSPTGNVTIKDGTTILGSVLSLAGAGITSYTTSALAVGTHAITANYAGDANNAATISTALSQVVNQATTSTVVGASANPVTAGKSVNLTATVTGNGGTPGGTVKFFSQGNLIGSTTLNGSGIATLATTSLAVGSDGITATYVGDANDAGSTSASYSISVVEATSSMNIVSSLNPATAVKNVTFTATVTGNGGTPTGQVIFSDGSAILSTIPLSAGIAAYTTSTLAVGAHAISAAYQGDSNDGPASANLTETIVQASPTIALTSDLNPSTTGASVVLSSVLSGATGTPTGSVVFQDGSITIGTVSVAANGTAALSAANLAMGKHSITATYGGDANNAMARSSTLSQTVQETTTIAVVSGNATSVGGTPITFTATVTGSSHGNITGTVTFKNGTATLGTASLNSAGIAALTVSTLPVGADSITAAYSGDTLNTASTSAPLTQTVQSASTATTLTSSANPSLFGASISFTATVTGNGATPTGPVIFSDGSAQLGSVNVNASGVAVFMIAGLTAGVHPITAAYGGDADNGTSVSPVVNQQVQQHTVVTLTSSSNPALAAATVTFSINIANGTGVAPTGTLTLKDGTATLTAFTVPANGSMTYSSASLAVGQHSIVAAYGGDTNNTAANSTAISEVIEAIPTKTTLAASPINLNSNQQVNLASSVFSAGAVPPTGTVTFQSGSSVIGTATLSSTGITTLTPTLTAGTYTIVAVYSGDADNATSTSAPVTVTVTDVNGFQMATNPPAVTVATTQHSTVTLTLTSTDGFTDQLGLGCASLPASVTCNFSSALVTLPANGSVSTQVTVDTASPLASGATAKNVMPGGASPNLLAALVFPGSAILGFFWWRQRRKLSALLSVLMLLLLSSAAITITGCGGLSSASAAPGTYTIQVTATGVKTGMNQAIDVKVTIN
jgi:large repetitive protein